MEQKRYRVYFSQSIGEKGQQMFEGTEYELRRRFPIEDFPRQLNEHVAENPDKTITFYFRLLASVNGTDWNVETKDPRL